MLLEVIGVRILYIIMDDKNKTTKIEKKEKVEDTASVKTPIIDKDSTETPQKGENKDRLFRVGDTVEVGYKIIEGGNERVQPFIGIVIAKKGMNVSRTFTVRKMGAKNIGVERIFPLHSPKISYVKIVGGGKVRRAKLYYLRQNRSKKDSKIKERIIAK